MESWSKDDLSLSQAPLAFTYRWHVLPTICEGWFVRGSRVIQIKILATAHKFPDIQYAGAVKKVTTTQGTQSQVIDSPLLGFDSVTDDYTNEGVDSMAFVCGYSEGSPGEDGGFHINSGWWNLDRDVFLTEHEATLSLILPRR